MRQVRTTVVETREDDFVTFTQQYARIIRHTIWRVCGTTYPALQDDVEQEVYLVLWERWQNAQGIDSPVSYLYKVALRTALAVLRTHAGTLSLDDVDPGVMTHHAAPADESLTTERALLLRAYLERVPEEQARAIRAYLAGFTQGEIAKLYGWSAAVTRHRIYRGIQALHALAQQEVR